MIRNFSMRVQRHEVQTKIAALLRERLFCV